MLEYCNKKGREAIFLKKVKEFFKIILGWRNWAIFNYNAFIENFFIVFIIALAKPDFSNSFIVKIILFYFFSLFSTAYGYLVNDFSDVELDRIHGKTNVFHDILASQRKYYVISAFILSAVFAIPFIQNVNFLILWGVWLFLSTFYSLEPIRLKTKGYLNILSIVLAQRLFPILLLFAALSFWIFPETIIMLLYVFIRGLSSDLNHQLVDYQLDVKTNTKTFVHKLGLPRSQLLFKSVLEIEKLTLICLLVLFIYKLGAVYSGLTVGTLFSVFVFYLLSYFHGLYRVLKKQRQNPFKENDKNIFQFLHHAFPSVLLPLISCLLMLKFNFFYLFILILIIINKQLFKPIIWSRSYPAVLLKKIKLTK